MEYGSVIRYFDSITERKRGNKGENGLQTTKHSIGPSGTLKEGLGQYASTPPGYLLTLRASLLAGPPHRAYYVWAHLILI